LNILENEFDAKQAMADKEAELLKERKERYSELTEAFLQTMAANIAASDSAEQFVQKTAASGMKALGEWAMKKSAFEFAEGLACLGVTWGVPNPGAANHFLAAAAYGILGVGMSVGSSALSSSSSSYGSSGSSSTSAGSSNYSSTSTGDLR